MFAYAWCESTPNICCVFNKTKELKGDLRETKATSSNVVMRSVPVADSGFSRGGAPTPKMGVLTYYFAIFLPKTA